MKLLHTIRVALFGWDLFISHKKDEASLYARAITEKLSQRKYRCFLDEHEIPAGSLLSPQIRQGLKLSQALLLIGTENALRSKYVADEINDFTSDIISINVDDALKNSGIAKLNNKERVWIDENHDNVLAGTPSDKVIASIELYFTKRKTLTQRRYLAYSSMLVLLTLALILSVLYLSNEKLKADNKIEQNEKSLAQQAAKTQSDSTKNARKLLSLQEQLTGQEKSRADQETRSKQAERIAVIANDILPIDPAKALSLSDLSFRYAANASALIVAKKALQEIPESNKIKILKTNYTDRPTVLTEFVSLKKLEFCQTQGLVIALTPEGRLKIVEIESGRTVKEFDHSNDFLLSQSGNQLFVLSKEGIVTSWSLKTRPITKVFPEVGYFSGICNSPKNELTVAWKKNGEIEDLVNRGQITSPSNKDLIALGIDDNLQVIRVLQSSGQMLEVPLDQKAHALSPVGSLKVPAKIEPGSDTNPIIKIWINKKLNKLALLRADESLHITTSDLTIFTANTLKQIWYKPGYFKCTYDPNNATISILDVREVEEVGLGFTKEGDSVREVSHWRLDNYATDLGEPMDLSYSRKGRFLVTVNAPVLDNVGPKPSLVKLSYTARLGDPRVGDEHQARQIGQSYVKVLNAAFNEDASALATYADDGYIRIYPILPENYAGENTRAGDFFRNSNFLSVPARDLIQQKDQDTFFTKLHTNFSHVILKEDSEEVLSYINGQVAQLKEIDKEKEMAARAGSAALQPRIPEKFDTYPFPDRELPATAVVSFDINNKPTAVDYDPLRGNNKLNDLITSMLKEPSFDDDKIIQRYSEAAKEDVLLLLGVQKEKITWLLQSTDRRERQTGFILSALLTDKNLPKEFPGAFDTAIRVWHDPYATWCMGFLNRFGRDFSPASDLAQNPSTLLSDYLLYFPYWKNTYPHLAPDSLFMYAYRNGKYSINEKALPWTGGLITAVNFFINTHESDLVLLSAVNKVFATAGIDFFYQKVFKYGEHLKEANQWEPARQWFKFLLPAKKLKGILRSNVLNQIAWLSLQLKDYRAAAFYYKLTVEANFPSGWANINWGIALVDLGDAKAGIEKMRQGLHLAEKYNRPELTSIYNEYAWAIVEHPSLVSAKEFKYAKQLSEKSCDPQNNRNVDYSEFLDTYAHFFAVEGNMSQAIAIEENAVNQCHDRTKATTFLQTIQKWESR